MQIFMVYDKKLEGFMPDTVICAANPLVASRRYSDICKHVPAIADHLDDYEFYRICDLDDDTGEIFDSNKALISSVRALYPDITTDQE